MRIAALLDTARQLGVDRLDAQLLLAHHLQRPRSWLLAHDNETLDESTAAHCHAQLERRAAGEPLAYVLGEWSFRGLRLQVTPAVLIPRPETELLVDWALQRLADAPQASAVDLGTGSGAIALALASEAPGLAVTASDASLQALDVARSNAAWLQLAITFVHGDWWQPLAGQRFGLAVSNPPYIAASDGHLASLVHEPGIALTPGGDGLGLDALRRIIQGAPEHLLPGAWLLLEHGHDQGLAVRDLLQAQGFQQAQTRADLAGLPRCSGARWLPTRP